MTRVPPVLACFCVAVFALMASPVTAQVTFTDFSNTSTLALNPSATTVTNGGGVKVLRLTSDGQTHRSGSAWVITQQNVATGFTSIFEFQITHSPLNGSGPADGIAFVIQNSAAGTSARGGSGGAVGYGDPDSGDNGTAIPNSLAVEFDTFQNGWDPDGNHIAVQSCGTDANTQKHGTLCPSSAPSTLGIVNSSQLGVNLADGQVHKAIIEYDPGPNSSGTLRVFVDNTAVPKLSVSVNLATLLSLADGQNAFVGFTGSVGGSTENNDILNWTFTPAAAETSVTQTLNVTGPNPSTDSVFGSYNHKVLNYLTTNSDLLTVTAIPETDAQYQSELNDQFHNSHCLIYDGTGGLCVKFQVSCSSSSSDCENLVYEVAENFNNNNQGNPVITGAGMLKRKTPSESDPTPPWSNIIESFSQSRLSDPGGKGKSTGFSEFVLCSGCTAPPTVNASPANGGYALSPATITFNCAPDPLAPNVTLVPDPCTATLNGNPVASGESRALNAVGTSNTLQVTATDSVGSTTQVTSTFTTGESPAITSGNSATFLVGSAGSFTFTASGAPAPSFSVSGALPTGVSFTGSGLAGIPAAGTGGVYPLIVTASNGLSPDALQSFTLTVNQAPSITSAAAASFQVGTAGSFLVTATGFPVPSLSKSGALPSGVTFVNNGNGTATLAGIPSVNGTFPLVFTASNTAGTVMQNFTLTVSGAQVNISPGSLNFGTLPFLGVGLKTVTLKNTGSVNLQITGITETLGQADRDDFTFVSLCPGTLLPGRSCIITVVFLADDLGSRTSTLNIFDNAAGGQQHVSMSATVVKKR